MSKTLKATRLWDVYVYVLLYIYTRIHVQVFVSPAKGLLTGSHWEALSNQAIKPETADSKKPLTCLPACFKTQGLGF